MRSFIRSKPAKPVVRQLRERLPSRPVAIPLATAATTIARGPISIGGKNVGNGVKVTNHVKLWDVATGTLKWTSPARDSGQVTSVLFSPDGLSIYCCDSSAVSRIDTRTGQTRKDLMTAGSIATK